MLWDVYFSITIIYEDSLVSSKLSVFCSFLIYFNFFEFSRYFWALAMPQCTDPLVRVQYCRPRRRKFVMINKWHSSREKNASCTDLSPACLELHFMRWEIYQRRHSNWRIASSDVLRSLPKKNSAVIMITQGYLRSLIHSNSVNVAHLFVALVWRDCLSLIQVFTGIFSLFCIEWIVAVWAIAGCVVASVETSFLADQMLCLHFCCCCRSSFHEYGT